MNPIQKALRYLKGRSPAPAIAEPAAMEPAPFVALEPPRFETKRPMRLAGLSARYSDGWSDGIPAQWQRLNEKGRIAGLVTPDAYGVSYNSGDDGSFDYLCGVEIAVNAEPPKDFVVLDVPAQRYAVFQRSDHIASIRQVFAAIWTEWLPQSGYALAPTPMIERYGREFDPRTGMGGYEIWIPVKG